MTTLGPKRGPFWKRAPRRRNSFVDLVSIILPLTSAPIPTPAEGSWSAWLDSFR